MCVNYVPTTEAARLRDGFGVQLPAGDWAREMWPRYVAPIIRRRADAVGLDLEAVGATWGLLPWWAKSNKLSWSTVNARSEEMAGKPAFRDAWRRAQRCIVPMDAFFEPNWESGRSVRWKFWRADGAPMGVAGLWEQWKPAEGEPLITFTALTINADAHALMSRMHKPGEEKRMLVVLDENDRERWLEAPLAEASRLLSTFAAERLSAEPAPLPPRKAADKGGV
jgi:putative SOS response-associated peptidase YedK